jgi:hypothetical protein
MGFVSTSSYVVLMNIKWFILFILIFCSFVVSAVESSVLIKKMQLALDKNQLDLVEDIYENNESTLSTQWLAQERLAISYERKSKYKEAIDTYKNLVNTFNKDAHEKVMKLKTNEKMEESFVNSNKLAFYYYKLAFLNAQQFRSTNKYIPFEERKKYLSNVQAFLQLCKRVRVENDDILAIEELVKEKIKFENELTFKSSWYSLFNLTSWQDRAVLINNTNSNRTKLLSTSLGTAIGLGKKWENSKYEFNLEGIYSIGSSTISSEDENVLYQQSSVSVSSFQVGPGFYYKGFSDQVTMGLFFPITYRIGDWSLPEGNYSMEGMKKFGGGYLFQIKFYISKIGLQARLGKIFPSPGSQWSVGGIYDF